MVFISTLRRRNLAIPDKVSAFWARDGANLARVAAATEEAVAAVGFEARHVHACGHVQRLQHSTVFRIDAPELADVAFPRGMPELTVRPCHTRDEAVRVECAE